MISRMVWLCSAILVAGCIWASGALADGEVRFSSAPDGILMDTFYNGATLKVSGVVPAGADVALRLVGAPQTLHLREKGKVFGLLWMNVGAVEFENVPNAYLIATSKPFADLGRVGQSLRIEGLRDGITQNTGASSANLDALQELLSLKVHDGLYAESPLPVKLDADQGAERSFSASIGVPSGLTPGEYRLEALALRDGETIGGVSTPVRAQLVGLPAWLNHMAFDNGLTYGVLATAIAILSGLAIGMVFQSKGAH